MSSAKDAWATIAAKPLMIRILYAVVVVCSLVVSSQLVYAAHGRQVRNWHRFACPRARCVARSGHKRLALEHTCLCHVS